MVMLRRSVSTVLRPPQPRAFVRGPSDRFFAVAYEEASRWVGVLADPYFATSGATLPELKSKLIQHIATERGRSPRELRLYTELMEANFAVDVLLRDWRDR